jgi:hypothetical protein
MEIIVILAILIVGLIGLDAAALSWGADSRNSLPDDHAR